MTPTDRRILETALWPPRRRQEVSAELGLGIVGATQRLLQLLDDPEAEQAEPVLIHHLQRVRERRRAGRSARRLHAQAD